ncbi:Coenzyme Q-binding protein coq10, mitochondrial [Saitoella coloradoensis]
MSVTSLRPLWKAYRAPGLIQPRRSFFMDALKDLPDGKPQKFTASRVLYYSHQEIYKIVSDIDAYSSFLPYCLESTVTSRDTSDYPKTADLRVGFKGMEEKFTSNVECSGGSRIHASASRHPLFKTLNCEWTITPNKFTPDSACNVSVAIEFAFTNPLYAAVGGAAAPKVAPLMIDAFQKRAQEVLGPSKK